VPIALAPLALCDWSSRRRDRPASDPRPEPHFAVSYSQRCHQVHASRVSLVNPLRYRERLEFAEGSPLRSGGVDARGLNRGSALFILRHLGPITIDTGDTDTSFLSNLKDYLTVNAS